MANELNGWMKSPGENRYVKREGDWRVELHRPARASNWILKIYQNDKRMRTEWLYRKPDFYRANKLLEISKINGISDVN